MSNRTTSHPLPNPWLCELHLALCRVAHACGAAKALDEVFYYDLDIMCPVAGEYTLPTTRSLVLIILTLPLILVSIVIALRTEGLGGTNDVTIGCREGSTTRDTQ